MNVESKIALHTNTEILNAITPIMTNTITCLSVIRFMLWIIVVRSHIASYVDDKKTQRNIEWYIWDCDIDGVTWYRILGENFLTYYVR